MATLISLNSYIFIETASRDSFVANKKGMVHIMLHSHPSHQLPDVPIMLTDVIYVPNLNANLLSIGCMTTAGVIVTFNKLQSSLSIDNNMFVHGPKVGNLFTFNAVPIGITNEISCRYATELTEASLWHHRLAHVNYSTLKKMSKHCMLSGLLSNIAAVHSIQCVKCPFDKQVRAPFKQIEDLPDHIGHTIASDVCSPFDTSMNEYKYFLTWIDLKTRYASIEFIKNKECSTVTDSFKRYLAWIVKQRGVNVKNVRTDNGGEYMGGEFQDLCAKLGIVYQTTSPYMPEHNGIAEHYNRTLQEGSLTLQHDLGLGNRF